jgi:hypothetical protein
MEKCLISYGKMSQKRMEICLDHMEKCLISYGKMSYGGKLNE